MHTITATVPSCCGRELLLPVLQLEEMRKNEDPRLSFSTPEFKEAQRVFTDNFKVRLACTSASSPPVTQAATDQDAGTVQNNFGRPVEWALVKDYAWSTPQLRKLDVPVSSH